MSTPGSGLGSRLGSRLPARITRTRVASGAVALALALMATFFVLGRGPVTLIGLTGRAPVWLPFAGSGLTWVPFMHRVTWQPFRPAASVATAGRTAFPTSSPGHSPSAVPAGSHTPTPTPRPGTGSEPAPTPTPKPSVAPASGPAPTPTPTPRPSVAPTATPTPTPTPTPSPTPTVLYANNFESDPLNSVPHGMTVQSGIWSVVADPGHVLSGQGVGTILTTSGSSWGDYRASALVKPSAGSAGVVARSAYSCVLTGGTTLAIEQNGVLQKTAVYLYSVGSWYSVALTAKGNNLTCTASSAATGTPSQSLNLSVAAITSGPAGLTTTGGAEFGNFDVVTVP